MSSNANGILSGTRVLDLSRVLAAPLATQVLADFGAEVIKIERPNIGSDERYYGPHFLADADGQRSLESAFHLAVNRRKRSVTVDITKSDGRELILGLAAKSDVFVENFIPGKATSLGLGYDAVRSINPRIVYLSLSGYGQTGPYANRPGYDAIFQAQSGMMSVTGIPPEEPGGYPMRTGPSLVDVATGQNAVIGILAALLHRTKSGYGQHIDLALFDTAIAMQSHLLADYLISGEQPPRRGTGGFGGYPSNAFLCADGYIYIAAGQDNFFSSLCRILGCFDITSDPSFATITMRGENRQAVDAVIVPLIAKWNKAELMSALTDARVPCSLINEYDEMIADPQVSARKIVVELPHPYAPRGNLPAIANPIRFSETPVAYNCTWPTLGEHTREVLTTILGVDEVRLEDLRSRGVI